MTSVRAMLGKMVTIAALTGVLMVSGCANRNGGLVAPQPTVSPYDSARGELLWAVVPVRNESGMLQADVIAISDRLVAAVEEVKGVRCVPLNRTLEAIVALELDGGVKTPAEARQLAQVMGVDGIVVGTLTAWEPYTPQMGLTLALFARPGAMGADGARTTDPRALTASSTGTQPAAERFAEKPVSTVSEHLDGKNHQVLMDVRTYAEGRTDSVSALHWRRYVRSMDLYQEFAAHFVVDRLIQAEWSRLARQGVRESDRAARSEGKPSGGRTIERWAGEAGNVTKSADR